MKDGCGNNRKKLTVLIVMSVLCLTAGYVAAKYIRSFESETGTVVSEAFYFTTDLTGDSRMVDDAGEHPGDGYQYEDIQEGKWNLYGGSAHEVTLQLRNYYDALRITQSEIAYTVGVEAKALNGNEIDGLVSISKNGSNGEAGGTDPTGFSGILGSAAEDSSYEMETENITLYVKSGTEISYRDGTEVIVTIASTAPYEKIMQLHFLLYCTDSYLCYEIKDSAGSPFAELILMVNSFGTDSGADFQPYLTWTKDLYVDNTNSLTYWYADGIFEQQADMEGRTNMQISRALRSGESESLYFFKKDVDQNYTTMRKVTEIGTDGRYTVAIP